MTQDELLDALEDERENFLDAIDGLSDEAMQMPGVVGDWSVKDILAHISAWEAELVKLLWQAHQGHQPTTVHFGSPEVDQLNAVWYVAGQERALDRVIDDFILVRKQTVRRVNSFSDEDLSDPKRFAWLKDYPLWTWIAQDSFKHEAEHAAQIRQWREQQNI